jgi:hypothetical protein
MIQTLGNDTIVMLAMLAVMAMQVVFDHLRPR